jgi:cell division protein FtsZ
MLFITAGMGGGTGTGAAPVIAKMAKDKGILTVAVVTIPFENEGDAALTRAVDGIHELVKNVDSLLIINNQKLYDYFGDQLIHKAFPQSDEVLATAVKGITEIISRPGYINVDFEDVRTMMKDSGMALMGSGIGSGKNRLDDAVQGALKSPLLNDFDLKTAKNLLINITAGQNDKGLLMQDLKAINDKIAEYTGSTKKFKTGIVWDDDPDFGDNVRITAIATGFKVNDLKKIANADLGNIIEIDRNFKYDKSQNLTTGSIIDDDTNNVTVIGYNPDGNVKRFHIDADRKPVLIKNPGEDISELENIPAIKRKEHNKKKD